MSPDRPTYCMASMLITDKRRHAASAMERGAWRTAAALEAEADAMERRLLRESAERN